MELNSIHFWMVFQLVIDFALVVLIVLLIRNMKAKLNKEAARETSGQVMEMMAPLVREAQAVAASFDAQLKEKKKLVYQLNRDLDSRIISLNLLLNRARAYSDGGPGAPSAPGQVYKQQEAILALHRQKVDSDAIAKKLGIPKGEVELVIDLKTKFQSKE